MKTSTTLKSVALISLLGAALAMPAIAQQGGGMGGGPIIQNQTNGMGPGGGMGGMGGMGRMGRTGGRGMRFNQNNTAGWMLMTPQERADVQTQMRAANNYAECKQIQTEHRVTMEARAKEKGVTLPMPRQNGCDRMQAMGFFN